MALFRSLRQLNFKFPFIANNPVQSRRLCSTHPLPLTTFSEDEISIRDLTSRLCKEKIAPKVKEMDNNEKMDKETVDALFANGLMGLHADPEFGGSGASFFSTMLSIEELGKCDPSVCALMDIHNTLCVSLLNHYGNKEQKTKYLTRMCTDTVSSFCLSEPNAGSDAFALKTRADDKGDHYLLNGGKCWISNSDMAGVFFVFANTDLSKGYKGITCFIVDRETPGLSVGTPEKKLGIRASGTCTVTFENVKVPKDSVVGTVGQGYKIAIGILNGGRIGIAAQMVGLSQGCFDLAVQYTLERKQFNRPIFEFQGMQHQIARMALQIEAARLLMYNSARMYDAGINIVKQGAMAKYYATELATDVAANCIKWMGGVGFTRDLPVEKFYRDSLIGAIYEGTSNMQLNTIAKVIKSEFAQ